MIYIYTTDGYHFPKYLIEKAKELSVNIPEQDRIKKLPEGDMITVWRGTDYYEFIRHVNQQESISWTTDKLLAVWFANRYPSGGSLWQATIPREEVICFTQCRKESEVIQYLGVQNPQVIEISPEEREQCIIHQKELNGSGLDEDFVAEMEKRKKDVICSENYVYI